MAFNDFQIPPPRDWQKFERLCRDIWAKEWNNPFAQLNGRGGQPQNGVDVYGWFNSDTNDMRAVQCKGKDFYNFEGVTEAELNTEVSKSLNFYPKISQFILATTAQNDAKIQQKANELSVLHGFEIHVLGWYEIVSLLNKYSDLKAEYLIDMGLVKDNNLLFFEKWYYEIVDLKTNNIDSFNYYTNYIVNSQFNVYYDVGFLDKLVAFANSIETFKMSINPAEVNLTMFKYFDDWINVLRDIVYFIRKNNNSFNIPFQNLYHDLFWVNTLNTNVTSIGLFIEYKKSVLRALFFAFVSATNQIINYVNSYYYQNFKHKCFDSINGSTEGECPSFSDASPYVGLNQIALFIFNQTNLNKEQFENEI